MSFFSELATIVRSLSRSPGYAVAVVTTLALGIGANSAIFSVVDAVLLRDLPYEDPEQVFRLREQTRFSQTTPISPNQFEALRESTRDWATVEALDQLTFNLTGRDGAERIVGAAVSPGFFHMLGVRPIVGRDFTEDDDATDALPEALISYGLWQSRFGGDENVVGQDLEMSWSAAFGPNRGLGEHFTIIGVLPKDFLPPYGTSELFVPAALQREQRARDFPYLFPFARLEGREPEAAQQAMSAIVASLPPPPWRSPEDQQEVGVALQRVGQAGISRISSALWILWSAVGLVLLAACANVANLMLTRNVRRQREIGVRLALGASRWRLWRWLLAESVMLSLAAAGLGLAIAWGALKLLHALGPNFLPRLQWITVDPRLFGFALAVAFASSILFGVLPALLASRSPWAGSGLRSSSIPRSIRRLGAALVIVQVALSVLLLVDATHLVRSFHHLLEIDLGFDTDRLATFEVTLPDARYPEREQREGFQQRVLERVESLPGVRSAALSSGLPLTLINTASRLILPHDLPAGDGPPQVSYRQVTEGFLPTLGVPLLAGRGFEARDVKSEPKTILINRMMAEKYWPDRSPIGDTVSLTTPGVEEATIVGIVGDVRQSGPVRDVRPTAFVPTLGSASFGVVLRLETRAAVDRRQLAQVIATIDPSQPIHSFRTFASPQDRWLGRPMFNAWAMSLFGALALGVSVLGLLAVLSFSVSQRTAEIGIRQALGARAIDVLRLIAGQGLRLVLVGTAAGVLLALASSRLISHLLHGVEATDPMPLIAAALLALLVATPAILIPARRAAALEPTMALRADS